MRWAVMEMAMAIKRTTNAEAAASVFAGIVALAWIPLVVLWGTLPVWLIWNWFMPGFGLPAITFLQAIGIQLVWDALAASGQKKEMHWPTMLLGRPLLIAIAYVVHLIMSA